MATVAVEVRLTEEDLLNAARQLGTEELDHFVRRILDLKARRSAPALPEREAELFLAINRGLPADLRARYEALIGRRRAEALTPEEHEELLRLSDEAEEMQAERLAALAELAQLRGTTIADLMARLGIVGPSHARATR